MNRSLSALSSSVFALVLLVSVTASADSTLINGAGATFPYPLYSKWFSEYSKVDPQVQINYQSIGSGGGIKKFSEGTIDFGASDSPMTDEQLKQLPHPAFHIPTALGAVVVTYQIPGIEKGLRLTSEVLADIFLGKITQWDDVKIAKENPTLKLPKVAILVVHRSDGSGTSGIFTDYLSKVSPEWKEKVGTGTAVNWPVGLGGKGNEGVTGLVKQTPGSVGYVELIYAEKNGLPVAELKNQAGHFVSPTLASVTAAAAHAKVPEDFRVSITQAEGKDAYPISGFTYLLVFEQMSGVKGQKIVEFLKWAAHDGQKFNEGLSYAKLPQSVLGKVVSKIAQIKVSK